MIRAHLRWLLERAGYAIRPYDVVADRRRWRWQSPARCGHAAMGDLNPRLHAALLDAVQQRLDRAQEDDQR